MPIISCLLKPTLAAEDINEHGGEELVIGALMIASILVILYWIRQRHIVADVSRSVDCHLLVK